MLQVNTTLHAYKIDYYWYCFCIAVHKCYIFVDKIKYHREQWVKCIDFSTEYNLHMIWIIPHFRWTHFCTESISFIVLTIVHNIVININKIELFSWYNLIFVCFDSFDIFSMHSPLYWITLGHCFAYSFENHR